MLLKRENILKLKHGHTGIVKKKIGKRQLKDIN